MGNQLAQCFLEALTREGNSFVITFITCRKEKQIDCLEDVQMVLFDLSSFKQVTFPLCFVLYPKRAIPEMFLPHEVVVNSNSDNKGSKHRSGAREMSHHCSVYSHSPFLSLR